jgi:hypothetical protein
VRDGTVALALPAVIQEPFEPGRCIKLILDADRKDSAGVGYLKGEQLLEVEGTDRHRT